jgi:hypothetical protein
MIRRRAIKMTTMMRIMKIIMAKMRTTTAAYGARAASTTR